MPPARNTHILIRSTVSFALGAFSFTACGDNAAAPNVPPTYKIVTTRDTIYVGELLDLMTTPVGNSSGQVCSGSTNGKLNFASSNASVVTVTSNGQALGVSAGFASVSAAAPCNTMTEPKTLTVINR